MTRETSAMNKQLTPAFIMSICALLLIGGAALVGVLKPDLVYASQNAYPSESLIDMTSLVFFLPVSIVCLFFARRGSLMALLLWLGLLYSFAYNYIAFIFDVPFGVLLLPHLCIVPLSISAMVYIAAVVDTELFAGVFKKTVPAKFSGAILIALAVFIIFHQSADIIGALGGTAEAPTSNTSLLFADFAFALPMLIFSGLALWKGRGIGYLAGGAMLFGYLLSCLGLILLFILDSLLNASPFDIEGFIAISLMIVICCIPLGFFLKAYAQRDKQRA